MTILGIETASTICSTALAADGRPVAELEEPRPNKHSEELAPMVKNLLALQGVKSGELDGVAVSIGPGSLTGLRIGLAFAKGLCTATGIPLVAVPTLEALAHRVEEDNVRIIPVLPARRGHVFTACYEHGAGGYEEISAPTICPEEEILAGINGRTIILGEASFITERRIPDRGVQVVVPEKDERLPSARYVAEMGARYLSRGKTVDVMTVEPVYMMEFKAKKWVQAEQHA